MDTFETIFDKDGLIKLRKDNYVPRESQITAAYKIYDALIGKKHFILEGPCGFGKTFAYLVPLFEYLHKHQGTAIIVTDGISLQEQLANKDIPFVNDMFRAHYNKEISFALLKGKGNFLCIKKYERVRDGSIKENSEQMKEIRAWAEKNTEPPNLIRDFSGDFSELSIKPDPILHAKISCVEDGECDGKLCREYSSCYYQKHKAKAQASSIIVTNYHIVFSDWKIGLSTLLPKYDIAIFDEAHEFAVKFRDFRVSKFSLASAKYLKSDISEIIDEYREINDIILDDIYEEDEESDHSKLEIIFSLSLDLVKEMEDYMKWLFDMSFKDNTLEENAIITEYTKLRDPQREKICNIIEHILKLFSDIKEVLEESNFGDGDLEISSVKYKGKISKITARLKGFANILRDCDNYSRDASIVYWLDKQSDYKERYTPEQRMSFCFKPIDVAPDIAESFLYRGDLSCIFTSATISTNGNFDYIKEQTGLNLCSPERIVEYIGESPFNLARQQFWYIPENALSGKDLNFDKSLPSQIDEIISATQGGALCLFTSNKNMKLCYNELASRIEIKYGINSFLQGQKPTNKLIKEFEEDTDSVLFATRTFFTGIDVPGYALRCLVIDKLPFPHLNDPAMKKIKSVYGSGIMFKKYSIPMMVITLKQAVGRGVRSIHDKCVISVLDNRIIEERAYKEVFRQTFPWNRGSRKVKYVQEFLFPETKDYL